MQSRILPILFWIIALVNLTGALFHIVELSFFTKPLLMILLGWYYIAATSGHRTISHKLIIAGFIFSWSGDMNLMFVSKNEVFFLLGLASFLVTHLLYILAFRNDSLKGMQARLLKVRPYIGIPILVLFGGLMTLLFNKIPPEMKVPVIVYASVITLMVLASINRFKRVSNQSFWLVFSGALLFMISDSVIAINKFYHTFALANFIIMLFYITGQFLIAKGTIKTV